MYAMSMNDCKCNDDMCMGSFGEYHSLMICTIGIYFCACQQNRCECSLVCKLLVLAVARRASRMDSRETPDWCISNCNGPQFFASPRACFFTAEVVHPRLATAAV
jgi:hypothetical protein